MNYLGVNIQPPVCRIEIRHQDQDWEDSGEPLFCNPSEALRAAFAMLEKPMVCGMVRVVNAETGAVLMSTGRLR